MPFKDSKLLAILTRAAAYASVLGTLLGAVNFGVTKIVAYDGHGPRISKLEAQMAELSEYQKEAHETKVRQEYADKAVDEAKRQVDALRIEMSGLRTDLDHIRYTLEPRR